MKNTAKKQTEAKTHILQKLTTVMKSIPYSQPFKKTHKEVEIKHEKSARKAALITESQEISTINQQTHSRSKWFKKNIKPLGITACVVVCLFIGFAIHEQRVYSLTLDTNGHPLSTQTPSSGQKNAKISLPIEQDFIDIEPGSFKGWEDESGQIVKTVNLNQNRSVTARWYTMRSENTVTTKTFPYKELEEIDDSLLETESYQKQAGQMGLDEITIHTIYRDDVIYQQQEASKKTVQEKKDAIWVKGTKIETTEVEPSEIFNEPQITRNTSVTAPEVAPQPVAFKNCTELRKVYPQGVGSDHEAYRPKFDRDNDGWACEIKGN